jgi:signal transduction histidine kinase
MGESFTIVEIIGIVILIGGSALAVHLIRLSKGKMRMVLNHTRFQENEKIRVSLEIHGFNMLSNFSKKRMQWEVLARIETKGIDLKASKRIYFS